MSLSPIGSAVFELLSRKHTYIQTDRYTSYYFRVRICTFLVFSPYKEGDIPYSLIILCLWEYLNPMVSQIFSASSLSNLFP